VEGRRRRHAPKPGLQPQRGGIARGDEGAAAGGEAQALGKDLASRHRRGVKSGKDQIGIDPADGEDVESAQRIAAPLAASKRCSTEGASPISSPGPGAPWPGPDAITSVPPRST